MPCEFLRVLLESRRVCGMGGEDEETRRKIPYSFALAKKNT